MTTVKLPNYPHYAIVFVALSGAFSVLFSAWLAHAGAELALETQRRLIIALSMQFIHTLSLLAILVWLSQVLTVTKNVQLARLLRHISHIFMIGICCFSGVLYLKSFHVAGFLSKLTPFGGSLLALAWLMIAVSVFRNKT